MKKDFNGGWGGTLALILALGAIPIGAVADIEPSSFPTEDARRFLGEWTLGLDFQGREVSIVVKFQDVDGKLGVTLSSPIQPQPQVITNVTKISRGLALKYTQLFGETEIEMTLSLRRERAMLVGVLSDATGAFSAEVRGEKGGKVPGRAMIRRGGQTVKITYGNLRVGSDDYKRLEEAKDGDVFEYTTSRAIKLSTNTDLRFGDVVVKTHNVADDYPGVYSLWLKKVGDDWHLVFNEEADVWGTMHNPEADVAEIPLTLVKSEKETKKFIVDLERNNDQGLLKLAWGPNQWQANFTLPQ